MGEQRLSTRPLVALYDAFADYTTVADTWADAGTWDCMLLKTKAFSFAAATHNLNAKILGSMDGGTTYPHEVEASFLLTAAAAPTTKSVTAYYTNLKVQVQPAGAGDNGKLSTQYAGASF